MQSSFNDLVKFLLEEYENENNSLTKKAAKLALQGALFASGITPSIVTKHVFGSDKNSNKRRVYKKTDGSYLIEADKACVSKAVDRYYKRFVDELKQLKPWGILNLKGRTKGEIIYAQDKFWDTVIIPNAKFVYDKVTNSTTPTTTDSPTVQPFNIETYTIKKLIEQINEYNKIAIDNPRISIDFFPIKTLIRDLILENHIPDENISLNALLNLIQRLFITVKGEKFDPRGTKFNTPKNKSTSQKSNKQSRPRRSRTI